MRNLLITTTLTILLASCNQSFEKEIEQIKSETEIQIVKIELETLINEIDSRDEKTRYKANKKYTGKILQITGRTNGMSSEGYLRLQVNPGQNVVKCYGLTDEYMFSVNENDNVQITGEFELVNIESIFLRHGVMNNCKGMKVK